MQYKWGMFTLFLETLKLFYVDKRLWIMDWILFFFYIKHYLQFTYEYDSKVRTVDLPKLVFFKKNKRVFLNCWRINKMAFDMGRREHDK